MIALLEDVIVYRHMPAGDIFDVRVIFDAARNHHHPRGVMKGAGQSPAARPLVA
jgi:hypothetical protein